jgi:RNA repair, ligase-Pnkp-associating, region of Hen1
MLLTISTTHQPATDLGFLLHKHPDRFQSFEETACWTALLVDAGTVERIRLNDLQQEANELAAILVTCAMNARQNKK